jgi:hypothetical protein
MTLRALVGLNSLSVAERDKLERWVMVVAEFAIHRIIPCAMTVLVAEFLEPVA